MDIEKEEVDIFDTYFSGTLVSRTNWATAEYDPTTINTLFAPARGAGFNQRIGNKCKIHRIKISGTLNKPVGSFDLIRQQEYYVRILLVRDKQSNGAQLNSEDVMDNSTTTAFLTHEINSNFLYRFQILKEKWIKLTHQMVWLNTVYVYWSLTEKFEMDIIFDDPLIINFNQTNSGTISSCLDESLHVIANTNMQTSEDQDLNLTYNSRVYYTDCE